MTARGRERLFGVVMTWTAVTSIFAWLPLVRIIGRPDGYHWRILGLSGSGTDGPFWIFIPLTAYVVTMLFAAFRLPRAVFHPMLLLWHAVVSAVVVSGAVAGGDMQGQGLHFSFALWLVGVPAAVFAVLTVAWVVLDARAGGGPVPVAWTAGNTRKIIASLLLLGAAVVLFRLGTNYNWVTAAAILTTIGHWSLLIQSFAPTGPGSRTDP